MPKLKKIEIVPLKDHVLYCPPSIPKPQELKEGKKTKVLEKFKLTLIAEGVIKKQEK